MEILPNTKFSSLDVLHYNPSSITGVPIPFSSTGKADGTCCCTPCLLTFPVLLLQEIFIILYCFTGLLPHLIQAIRDNEAVHV